MGTNRGLCAKVQNATCQVIAIVSLLCQRVEALGVLLAEYLILLQLRHISSFQGFFVFIRLYIFLHSLPLLPSPMVSMLPIYSGDLAFFYFS